jgi:DNA polymerase-3 subunit delta'
VGKFMAARHFAAGIFCSAGPGVPCGSCGPCHRFGSGGEESNHPDLLEIDPIAAGEESIRIGHIAFRENDSSGERVALRRTVEGFLDLKPQEGAARVVILREADRLNTNAQNALLKTLEEPREGTLLILIAGRPDALLDTVISRVTRVHFAPLEAAETMELIGSVLPGVGPSEARALARWSGGSPGRAAELHAQGRPAMAAILADVLRGRRGPIAAGQALWQIEGDFPGKTERAKERRRARAVLDLLLEFAADLGALATGVAPERLAHGELFADLVYPDLASRLDPVRERLIRSRSDIDANLTPGAVLDSALLALAHLAPRTR